MLVIFVSASIWLKYERRNLAHSDILLISMVVTWSFLEQFYSSFDYTPSTNKIRVPIYGWIMTNWLMLGYFNLEINCWFVWRNSTPLKWFERIYFNNPQLFSYKKYDATKPLHYKSTLAQVMTQYNPATSCYLCQYGPMTEYFNFGIHAWSRVSVIKRTEYI